MQITTATGRTVEIYANTEAGITYRNVKDGKAYGATRSADCATAKAGSVGREILDAIDAQAAAEVTEIATETATEVAPITASAFETVAAAHDRQAVVSATSRTGKSTAAETATRVLKSADPAKGAAVFKADGRWGTVLDGIVMTGRRKGHPGFGRRYVSVLWTTAENGAPRPSYGFVYLDEVVRIVAAPSASQTAPQSAEDVLAGPVAGTGREARSEVQKRVRAALIRNAVGLRFE